MCSECNYEQDVKKIDIMMKNGHGRWIRCIDLLSDLKDRLEKFKHITKNQKCMVEDIWNGH